MRGDRRAPWVVGALVAAVYVLFAVVQWRALESPSWDLAIFTQLAQAYAHLEAPVVTIKGEGFNLLGDHFHPILVLLGPVYALFPSGLSLLVVQAVLLGVSAVPVTAVARELLGGGRGTALGLAYGLSWGLQGAVAAQFHEIAFAVPLLAFAAAAFLRGRWRACAVWAAPLVLVKEDLGLTVVALGAVLVWRGRRTGSAGQARAGAGLALWGAVWFVVTLTVLLPALNPRGTWDYYGRLGSGEQRSVLDVVLGAFVPGEKYLTLALLLAAAGVVGAASPLVWVAVPTLAWRFLGNVEHYWGWQWHYSAVLMPVAAAALLDVVARREARRGAVASLAVGIAVATTAVMLALGPLARLVQPQSYREPERAGGARGALEAVAPGATLEADIYLMAYHVPRARVYWVGNEGNPAPDYVQLDTLRRTWPDRDITDAAALAESRHPGTEYELVLDAEGYQVARRLR